MAEILVVAPQPAAPVTVEVSAPPNVPPTPWTWRAGIALGIIVLGGGAYGLRDIIGPRGQALAGMFCFFGLVALFSANLRAVNWRTIAWGVALQIVLALLVLKVNAVYEAFEVAGSAVKMFIGFSDKGAQFVFGNLADARPADAGGTWAPLFPTGYMFQFAFIALPPILFVSAFFTVLYHFGILQWCVRLMAWGMV
jgi:concentrative nucleoside transporter, CNT family